MKRKKPTHPALRFQRQVFAFSIFAILLFGVSLLVMSSRTEIVFEPILQRETVKETFHIGDDGLAGLVLKETLSITMTTKDLPPGTTEDGYATGSVTITNDWTQAQALQEGTRLLAKEGILFRTQERVDVPSRGAVTVNVKADQPGGGGDIGPTTFEIVALWEGLKKDIVGKSDTAFTGGVARVSRLNQETLSALLTDARNTLEEKAQAKFFETLNTNPQTNAELIGVNVNVFSETHSANVGDVISELSVTVTGEAFGIAADRQGINQALRAAAEKNSPAGTTVSGLVESARVVDIQGTDFVVHDLALVSVTDDHTMFDRNRLTGRSREELLSYFEQFDTVKVVDVRFSPFWSRSASRLPNNITITLLKPKE